MKDYTTILRPTFDAMSSKLLAGLALANFTHLNITLEQKRAAILTVAQTYWIELVSIFMLCLLSCVALHYFRSSSSRKGGIYIERQSSTIGEDEMQQQQTLINEGAGHLTGYKRIEHHGVTNIGDAPLPAIQIQQITKEWEELTLPGRTRPTMSRKINVKRSVPEETAAGPWEPRRSGRARKATKRFEESWYNGSLQNLGSSLGVEL